MVPAAGIAATADEAVADDGDLESFVLGTDASYTNQAISQVSIAGGAVETTPSSITLKEGAYATTTPVLPVSIKAIDNYDDLVVAPNGVLDNTNYTVLYYSGTVTAEMKSQAAISGWATVIAAQSAHNVSSFTSPLPSGETGSYYAVVVDGSSVAASSVGGCDIVSEPLEFEVIGSKSFNAANTGIYVGADATKTATEFTYGEVANFAAEDGNGLKVSVDGQNVALTDIDPTYYWANGSTEPVTDIDRAGKYSVTLKGAARTSYYGSEVTIPFSVNKLVVSSDTVVTKVLPTTFTQTASLDDYVDTIDGVPATNVAALITMTEAVTEGTAGEYDITLASTNPNIDVVDNTYTVYVVVEANVDAYANNTLLSDTTAAAPLTIDLSARSPRNIKPNDIKVGSSASAISAVSNISNNLLDNDGRNYTITVTNANGDVVPNNQVLPVGNYKVEIVVDAYNTGYKTAGTVIGYISVVKGEVGGSGVEISYNNVNVDSTVQKFYTGKNYYDGFKVVLKDTKGNVVPESNYTVKCEDTNAGVETTDFTNAGSYRILVELSDDSEYAPVGSGSDSFSGNNDCALTVSPRSVNVADLKLADAGRSPYTLDINGTGYAGLAYAYTAADITPSLMVPVGNEDADTIPSNPSYVTLPADQYTAEYGRAAQLPSGAIATSSSTKVKDAGFYAMKVTDASPTHDNYTISTASPQVVAQDFAGIYNPNFSFVVADTQVFADVKPGDWFYDSVNSAKALGYMNGYSGTKLFGPNDKITRGQVACVLFNMAGGKLKADSDDQYTETEGWNTGFSDVDGKMYYAEAIAWARQAGVVNGFGGMFRPEDDVTREEFACMLANYAKKMGNFEAPSAEALAGMPDAGRVSDWAKESVGWAVENKYMGNGGVVDPASGTTRAETAAMAVNYQPKAL